jgi:hypothetical protein
MELLQKQGFSPQAMGRSIKVWTHQFACCCTVASRFSPYEHLHWCLVCDPAKIFFPLVIYFFPTLPIKLKMGLQVGGRLLIAKHLVNQKQGAAVTSFLLHFPLAGVQLCCAFYQPQQSVRECWAKTILLSQTGMFWLFFIQF